MNGKRTDAAKRLSGAGRGVVDTRKQAVSIRMSRGDVRQIKQLADRLGVRDSDVVRYAIKTMLSRLAPLPDETVRGFALLPVFVESGADLMRHFDLDATRLAEIINEGAESHRKVDAGDIQLIAMSATQAPYAKMRFAAMGHAQPLERAQPARTTDNGNGHDDGNGNGRAAVREPNGRHVGPADHASGEPAAESAGESLRQYIYDKYLFSLPAHLAVSGRNGT